MLERCLQRGLTSGRTDDNKESLVKRYCCDSALVSLLSSLCPLSLFFALNRSLRFVLGILG